MAQPPVIILVNPQLVENIGTTARAMMNCRLTELRLVAPRDPWPLGEVHAARMAAASSGADDVLEETKVFPSVEEAIADLHYVYATTARPHDMVNRILTARAAAPDMVSRSSSGQRIGVLFGPERTGLLGDHVALAHARITVPLNPEFSSLNLAQAVLLVAYEWRQALDTTSPEQLHMGRSRPATQAEFINFFQRLETILEGNGFFCRRGNAALHDTKSTEHVTTRRDDRTGSAHLARRYYSSHRAPRAPQNRDRGKCMSRRERLNVFIRDLKVELRVGILDAEHRGPQPVVVNVTMEMENPPLFDDRSETSLERTIDYVGVHDFVTNRLANGPHIPLLETVADEIASYCFENPRVARVRIRLEKPQKLAGSASSGIDLIRSRNVS